MVLIRRGIAVGLALLSTGSVVLTQHRAFAQEAREAVSIRDGVFTAEQARRGEVAYTGPCDRCHGYKLDGASDDPDMLPAPPVAGPKFLRNWNGRTLAALFLYLRATMPANNPGYLSDAEIVDIVAYMLSASELPSGAKPLRPDVQALGRVVIEP